MSIAVVMVALVDDEALAADDVGCEASVLAGPTANLHNPEPTEVSWNFLEDDDIAYFHAGTPKASLKGSSNWFGQAGRASRTKLGFA